MVIPVSEPKVCTATKSITNGKNGDFLPILPSISSLLGSKGVKAAKDSAEAMVSSVTKNIASRRQGRL